MQRALGQGSDVGIPALALHSCDLGEVILLVESQCAHINGQEIVKPSQDRGGN